MISFLVSSPVPSILTVGSEPSLRRTRPRSNNIPRVTTVPASNFSREDKFTVCTSFALTIDLLLFLPIPRRLGSFLIMSRICGRGLLPARAV